MFAVLDQLHISLQWNLPAKPLYNHNIVLVYFSHFYCMEICDKLRSDLAIFTYIYLSVAVC